MAVLPPPVPAGRTTLPARTRRPGAASRAPFTLLVAALAAVLGLLVAGPAVATAADRDGGLRLPGPAASPGYAPTGPLLLRWGNRDDPDFLALPKRCTERNNEPIPMACPVVARGRKTPLVVLWGDSHALQLVPALRTAIGRKKVSLTTLIYGGCPPMFNDLKKLRRADRLSSCDTFGHTAIEFLRDLKRSGRRVRVVVGTSWELYHDAVTPHDESDDRWPGFTNDWVTVNGHKGVNGTPRAFQQLNRVGFPVDVVGQMPLNWNDSKQCSPLLPQDYDWGCVRERQAMLKDGDENGARISKVRALLSRPGKLIQPSRELCSAEYCQGVYDNLPVYYDQLHIGARVSRKLAPYFAPTVAAAARARH